MASNPWKIMVVDDCEAVHEATEFALGEEMVCGKPLQFIKAYSAKEAREILNQEDDVAVILLDVVMEKPDAGLTLIDDIRASPKFKNTRVVIRTGQPGLAPERELMQRYQIDDYRSKNDLTFDHLLTVITGSIRSYLQTHDIQRLANGMEKIALGTTDLLEVKDLSHLGNCILQDLALLLEVPCSGFVKLTGDSNPLANLDQPERSWERIAVTGRFQSMSDSAWEAQRPELDRLRKNLLGQVKHHINDTNIVLVLPLKGTLCAIIWMDLPNDKVAKEVDTQLLYAFTKNIMAGFHNLSLLLHLKQGGERDEPTGLLTKSHLLKSLANTYDTPVEHLVVALVELIDWDLLVATSRDDAVDQTLVLLARWFKERLPAGALVARMAENRLGLVFKNPAGEGQQLFNHFQRESALSPEGYKVPIPIRAKIGWSQPREGGKVRVLLREAALALNLAKCDANSHVYRYHPGFSTELTQRIELSQKLNVALETGTGLELEFQPIQHLKIPTWMGAEALCRWNLPDGTSIPPSIFIPMAEGTGLISKLGIYLFRAMCQASVRLNATFAEPVRLSINCSFLQLQKKGFVEELIAILNDTGASPSLIEIELTESARLEDFNRVVDVTNTLKGLGFWLTLDNVGTGCSTLTHVLSLPVHGINLAYSVVTGMDRDERHFAVVRAMVGLAHDMGLVITAKGLERKDQLQMLSDLDCDKVQGFFLGKPMGESALLEWMENRQQHHQSKMTHLSETPKDANPNPSGWDVLILDMDSWIHDQAKLALENYRIAGTPLHVYHEYRVDRVQRKLEENPLPAVLICGVPDHAPGSLFDLIHQIFLRSDFYQTQIVLLMSDQTVIPADCFSENELFVRVLKSQLTVQDWQGLITDALTARMEAINAHTTQNALAIYRRQLDIMKRCLDQHLAKEEALVRKMEVDWLTGAATRAVLEKALNSSHAAMERTGTSLAFLMIDIDGFKEYNDTYGHVAGDRCLRNVARTISTCCSRATDTFARYGGEEFAIVAPYIDLDGAAFLAQKILTAVRELQEPHEGLPNKYVTVSIGVTAANASVKTTPWSLVDAADRALYQAKDLGKDQFCIETL